MNKLIITAGLTSALIAGSVMADWMDIKTGRTYKDGQHLLTIAYCKQACEDARRKDICSKPLAKNLTKEKCLELINPDVCEKHCSEL